MSRKPDAYVTGSRWSGYRVVMLDSAPLATQAEFLPMCTIPFERFGAARLFAKAINEDARRMRARGAK
jgi:hypothetical protein